MLGSPATGSPVEVTSSIEPQGFPDCYKTRSGECGESHVQGQGDCGEGEGLVLGYSGLLECQKRDCHPEKILKDGKCLDKDETSASICTGSGKLKYIVMQNVCSQIWLKVIHITQL